MCQVTDLINWAAGDNSLLSQDVSTSATDGLFTLSSVTVNMYFNLVCQVRRCDIVIHCNLVITLVVRALIRL